MKLPPLKLRRTFPKRLGAAADKLYEVRQLRLEIERRAKDVKAYETELQDYLIDNFKKSELEGAEGAVARVGLNPKTVARVTDWDALWKYVTRKKAFDLIQRRVNDRAYLDRLEAKERIPGTEPFRVVRVSVTKRRAK